MTHDMVLLFCYALLYGFEECIQCISFESLVTTAKALEGLLRKAKKVVFVGGLSQDKSTTCERHGTEDVDVLVLALHICRDWAKWVGNIPMSLAVFSFFILKCERNSGCADRKHTEKIEDDITRQTNNLSQVSGASFTKLGLKNLRYIEYIFKYWIPHGTREFHVAECFDQLNEDSREARWSESE